jgi:predicted phage terminase large subunit-like protein
MTKNLDNQQQQVALLSSKDFLLFVDLAFAHLYPGQILETNWHLEVLAELARQIASGDLRKLMVALPPRSLKSFIFSICLPAYLLGKHPGRRILCASYGAELARQHSADCRKIMMSDWYQKAFPQTRISASKSTEVLFETTANGSRRAVSAEGSVTGLGGDVIIADDLVSASDAHNMKVHQDRTDWFFRSLITRINKPNEGVVVVIGQRLHIDDPMGRIAAAMPMKVMAVPAIAQEDRIYDLAGGRTYAFKTNEVLHPAMLDAEELASRRRSMGAADFSAQYLQDPLPDGGGALDFSMHKRFERAPSNLMIFHSWDTARTAGGGDFTVGVKFGYANENYFILDMYQVQFDYTQVVKFIRHKMRVDQPAWSIIETADGSGDAVHRTLTQEYGIRNISPHHPKKSKEDRFYEIVPMIEGGNVYIPTSAPWLQEYRNQVMSFPSNSPGHDDMLDAVSQFLRHGNELIRRAGGVTPTKYFRNTPVYHMIGFGQRRLVKYS